jgi:hypothetical protein
MAQITLDSTGNESNDRTFHHINSMFTELYGDAGAQAIPLPIADGGTNAITASAARTSLGVAASGANADITSITGLTTPLAKTLAATLAANATQTQAAATVITKEVNLLTTVGTSGDGVRLPVSAVGTTIFIFNTTSNPAQVYGDGTTTIDGVTTTTGVVLTNAKRAMFVRTAAGTWISAQLGVVSA